MIAVVESMLGIGRVLKKAHVVILRSQGDEESLVIFLRFFALLRMTDLLREILPVYLFLTGTVSRSMSG